MAKFVRTLVAAVAAFTMVGHAQATRIIPLVNGDFEDLVNHTTGAPVADTSVEIGDLGATGALASTGGTDVAGWTTEGFNFVFTPGTATTSGAVTHYGPSLVFHGPGNGTANGFVDSPAGGNFIASDGAFTPYTQPLSQTVSGLTVGNLYAISFWYASAQQLGYDGDTTSGWTVSLGSESWSTPTNYNPNHGFTDWQYVTKIFTAQNTTETLSFLAYGAPEGQPPFSLLDGISAMEVPEPATWAMMLLGFGLIGGIMRRSGGFGRATDTAQPRLAMSAA
jgi:hypothetical protein